MRKRNISWEEKINEVNNSFKRIKDHRRFPREFYRQMFKIKPEIEEYFKDVDLEHQEKLLLDGIKFCLDSIQGDKLAKIQLIQISQTHSQVNLNINPKYYYYFIESFIRCVNKYDPEWYDDMEYYWHEILMGPISFMISQYYRYTEIGQQDKLKA